jgi:hypothetical protein
MPEGEDAGAESGDADDGAARSDVDRIERIDRAFERFGAAADGALTPAGSAEIETEETVDKPKSGPEAEPEPEPEAAPETGDSSATGKISQVADSLVWRPHVNYAWVTLVAFGLAAGASRRRWHEEVDRALEESDARLSRRATRWLSRLRNRNPH